MDYKYTVDIDLELLVERTIDKWVLAWCKKYHPEAFEEAEKFVSRLRSSQEKKK